MNKQMNLLVDCFCLGRKSDCPICEGFGKIYEIKRIEVLARKEYIPISEFSDSFSKDFYSLNEVILPEKVNFIIREYKRKVIKVNDFKLSVMLRTHYEIVDYALGYAIGKVIRNIDLLYEVEVFKNKKFIIEIEVEGKVEELDVSPFDKSDYYLEIIVKLSAYFRRKYWITK